MVKDDQQGMDLEFRVGYSISGQLSPKELDSVGLSGNYNGELTVKALNGSEAQEKVKGVIDSKLKTVAEFYRLRLGNAIQLGDPSQISSLSQYVVNEVERWFDDLHQRRSKSSSSELKYDNRYFTEQLIPLISKAVQNKQEVGPALDLVTEKIKYDGNLTQ